MKTMLPALTIIALTGLAILSPIVFAQTADTTPPECAAMVRITGLDPHGDPGVLGITVDVRDPESGIAMVRFMQITNANVTIDGIPGQFFIDPFYSYHIFSPEVPSFRMRAMRASFDLNNQGIKPGSVVVMQIINGDGLIRTCDPVLARISAEVPLHAALEQNYPNPFNPSTRIGFSLSEAGPVSLRIYDTAGRLVSTVLDETKEAGIYEVEWDGLGQLGQALPGGVYLYRLQAGRFTATRAMMLAK